MKVLFLTNVPSPYMIEFFREFSKLCELTVVFEKKTSTERDSSWLNFNFNGYEGKILKGISFSPDSAFSPSVIFYIEKFRDKVIIVSNPTTPTGIFAIFYMKLMGIKYIIESEGGFAKSGHGIKERIKNLIIRKAYAYLSTTEIGDNYFLTYGANKLNIFKYPFSSVHKNDVEDFNDLETKRVRAREELNISYDYVILSVGRIIKSKGHDITIKAFSNLKIKNVGLFIVGGNISDELSILIKQLDIKNIHFIDFLSKSEVSMYYIMSDIFVLSTRYDTWGLVINEAMAKGLPVITTNMCIAGSELIEDNINGFKFNNEDVNSLTRKMHELLTNKELRNKISHNNILKINNYTIEEMANKHMEICNYLINSGDFKEN